MLDDIRAEFAQDLHGLVTGLHARTDDMRGLDEILAQPEREPSVHEVIRAAAKESGYSVEEIRDNCRKSWRAMARGAGMLVAYRQCRSKTSNQIAQVFERHDSTVRQMIPRLEARFHENVEFRAMVRRIERRLMGLA